MDRGDEKKISIELCKEIFKKHGFDYSDEEVEKIRDFLYTLAEIEYTDYINKKKYEKGDSLHKSFDG